MGSLRLCVAWTLDHTVDRPHLFAKEALGSVASEQHTLLPDGIEARNGDPVLKLLVFFASPQRFLHWFQTCQRVSVEIKPKDRKSP